MALAPIQTAHASRSGKIKYVQGVLNEVMGAGLSVDGVWSMKTRETVRQFQMNRGLNPDGIVGPQTSRELERALDEIEAAEGKIGPVQAAFEALPIRFLFVGVVLYFFLRK